MVRTVDLGSFGPPVAGYDDVVRRLADSDKAEFAHHHVELLHLAAHLRRHLLDVGEPARRVLAASMPASVRLKSAIGGFPLYDRGTASF
jgi:hypothetical protein